MTEGRFETVHNLRPKNWDHRRHWTNWHHLYDCEGDHIARESCPFHDLRAGGQFQYEYSGGGPFADPVVPPSLNVRPDGDRMDFSPGRGTGMSGWGDIPLDTDPGRPQVHNMPDKQLSIFTKKNPLKRGYFSAPNFMPEGEKPKEDPLREGYMKAGGNRPYGFPPEYIVDPYNDKIDRGRISHLKTGNIKYDFPNWMPEGEEKRRKKKCHGPFLAGKPNSFNIGGEYEWIPDPYCQPKINCKNRTFQTWHTSTKWSMPTYAPWTTGLSTAEHRKGKHLDLTESGIPNLSKHPQVSLSQTIGPVAALTTGGCGCK